jgi:tetratricopeptide (TPR) repeat protein
VVPQYNNCHEKAIDAYEKAAEANLRGGGTAWHASKHLEDAAKLSVEVRSYSKAAEFSRQASQNYVDCGKLSPAAECLARGARWLEDADLSSACSLYQEAVVMYAKSEMAAMAHDIVQRAVMVMLRAQRPEEAAAVMLRWATICHNTNTPSHLCRAYLSMSHPPLHLPECVPILVRIWVASVSFVSPLRTNACTRMQRTLGPTNLSIRRHHCDAFACW